MIKRKINDMERANKTLEDTCQNLKRGLTQKLIQT